MAGLAQAATFAYITNARGDSVSVVDTASNTVLATVPVGYFPVGVAVTPDGARIYVANEGSSDVSVIASASNALLATVPVGRIPAAFGRFIGPAATFPFNGFFLPVNNLPTFNAMKAGAAVPVKFSLGGARGLASSPTTSLSPNRSRAQAARRWTSSR